MTTGVVQSDALLESFRIAAGAHSVAGNKTRTAALNAGPASGAVYSGTVSESNVNGTQAVEGTPKTKSGTVISTDSYILDLKLAFSPENLQKTLDSVISAGKTGAVSTTSSGETRKIFETDLAVSGERTQKTRVETGNGEAREISTYQYHKTDRRTTSDYRIDRIKLRIERRQHDELEARTRVYHSRGYRIVYRKISQRYSENLSLAAELQRKFTDTAASVEAKVPEASGAFIKTTERLVDNGQVQGKTISAFFDTVQAHLEKSRQTLHARIDMFMRRLSDDLKLDESEMVSMQDKLHETVDTFFSGVNRILDSMETDNLRKVAEQSMETGEAVIPEIPEEKNLFENV